MFKMGQPVYGKNERFFHGRILTTPFLWQGKEGHFYVVETRSGSMIFVSEADIAATPINLPLVPSHA
jgi:hypothetical protein